jgi:hypothetical protein
MSGTTQLNVAHFLSLFLTALCLGPALAHLLELPNKLGLGREDYFTVQQIYRGWAILGILIVAAIAAAVALAWMSRRLPGVFYWVLTALVCLAAAQAVFWIFTYPANVATRNWTTAPANWQALRVQWEYSHAVGAILTLAALAALIVSLLARTRATA